ncbi:hypothetical protein GGR57DRAFT_494317 [Xylariaceae sp. FL1272]|nr:hypothetical protein GGR57DRAFT_494317 [Xylariaceae sp. FL1272]
MAASYVLALTTVMIVLSVVSLAFMSLRFYSKYLTGARFWLDDICLASAWIIHLVFVVLSLICIRYGLGHKAVDLDLTQLPTLLKLLPIAQFFAVIAVSVSKTSFILTMLRLCTRMWQKAILYFLLASVNASLLSISIVQFFQCGTVPTAGCVPGNSVIALGVFAAGYSAAVDLFLVGFPVFIIWNLQMQQREKIGIIVSMSLGVIAGVVGIYKSSTIPEISRSADFTYGTALVLIWLVAEVCATIIASSIPFYRPLLRMSGIRKNSKIIPDSYNLSDRRTNGHSKLSSNRTNRSELDDNSDKDILRTRCLLSTMYETHYMTATTTTTATRHRPATMSSSSWS